MSEFRFLEGIGTFVLAKQDIYGANLSIIHFPSEIV